MSRPNDLETKLLRKVLKTKPKSSGTLAWELGFVSYHSISYAIGNLVKTKQIQKTKFGYVKI